MPDLTHFLPHRPPMIWVDQILKIDPPSASALIIIDLNKLYFTHGFFNESSYVEFIAQSFGYSEAAKNLIAKNGQKIQKGFLSAIDTFEIHSYPIFKNGDKLIIEVETLRIVGPLTFIEGTVKFKDFLLASAKLKIYGLIE